MIAPRISKKLKRYDGAAHLHFIARRLPQPQRIKNVQFPPGNANLPIGVLSNLKLASIPEMDWSATKA